MHSHLSVVWNARFGLFLWAVLQSSATQAAIVSFTSLVDPSPDILLPTPSYTYQHDLNSVGFNPVTDTLTSAEFHVYFAEENWLASTDDSVTVSFEGGIGVISSDPSGIGNSSWDDVFSVDVGLLQTDGILTVTLESVGGTFFEMSELTVQATSAVPIPPAILLFASGILGLIGIARRKAA